jgi:FMN-dependent NADH-azoreductase
MKLLHIDSSVLGDASASRQLSAAIVEALTDGQRKIETIHRDLAADAPGHLDGDILQAIRGDEAELSEAQRRERDLTDAMIEEFLAADAVIIGAPMYNFAIPSQLKAWLDRLAQAGRTFRYTESGPVGLAGGKTVYIASSRGGKYFGTEAESAMDHQEAYLKAILGFFGITDVRIIRAEGLAMGDEARTAGLKAASAEIAVIEARKAA